MAKNHSRKHARRGGAKTRRSGSRKASRGVFSSILKPVGTLVRGVGNIAGYTVKKGYRTVRHVADHAERAVGNVASNLTRGAAGIVDRSANTLNRTVRSVIGKSKRNRRNRRK